MKRKHGQIPRLLITLLGIGFIIVGASEIMLGFVGRSTPAVITGIRREGGERTDVIPGRYTYNIGYTFTLPDGREIHGFTKKIGDAVYLKADGKSTITVRYLPAFPFVNAPERDSGPGVGQFVLIIAGGFLISVLNRGKA